MIQFEKNLGGWDRRIRLMLGLFLLYAGLFKRDWIGDPILIGLILFFGAMNIISAIIAWCPPYALIGFSTRKK